jgi:hypothetical protein
MTQSALSAPNSGSSGSLWISSLAAATPPHYQTARGARLFEIVRVHARIGGLTLAQALTH